MPACSYASMLAVLTRKTAQGIVREWATFKLSERRDVPITEDFDEYVDDYSRVEQALLYAERNKLISQLSSHVTKVTLSSAKQDWLSPPYFLDIVRQIGPIALDPCANVYSFVHAWWSFYGPQHVDGLRNSWWVPPSTVCFVNPPYGRMLTLWAMKMASEYGQMPTRPRGSLVALVPARTGTGYWERFIWPFADAVCFWHGGTKYPSRMRFYDLSGRPAPTGATFDAAVVYFGTDRERFASVLEPFGTVQLCN